MATNCMIDTAAQRRLRRPLSTTTGFTSDVDATVQKHLAELNGLLGKRIHRSEARLHDLPDGFNETASSKGKAMPGGRGETAIRTVSEIKAFLQLPLTPKRVPQDEWDPKSLAHAARNAMESHERITLAEHIDLTPELSALKYAFRSQVNAGWFNLEYNVKTILDGYPAILDYLVAYAYEVMGYQEVNGLKNFILNNRAGAASVINYASISAARSIIDEEQLKVPGLEQDNGELARDLISAKLQLSAASFRTAVQAVVNDLVFSSKEEKLIEHANLGPLPTGIQPLLIKYIKHSTVPITEHNVKFFLPLFISQIQGSTVVDDPSDVGVAQSDQDFDVQFLEDDESQLQISRSAVKCAAQLFYGMVLGDELDVFDAMNFFTHKYLIRGGIEVQSSRLREDLQMYVFSNRFTDLKTKKILDRTRPAERRMFYRQVFDIGNARVTEDVIVNPEFQTNWKLLMLESAKYIEKAQASPNPESYVSPQNIMQAVEDLQYNLGTHCTGMVNVITPLIYAELDFIIRRIFMHPEILRQIVPAGGTWWRVVETLHVAMKHSRPKATVLYNKAKLGHDIIRAIADYNPASFEDDKTFFDFLSKVEAFITTQSILQDALTDDLKREQEEEPPSAPEPRSMRPPEHEAEPAADAAEPAKDEWAF